MDFSTPVENLSQIGSILKKRLKKLGINNLKDLLFHFPHRYENFSKISPISQIKVGESFCLKGKILEIKNSRTWKKKMILTQAILADQTGAIKVIWFNQPYLIKILKAGDLVYLAGKVSQSKEGIYLSSPGWEKFKSERDLIHTGRLVAIYPETEGLSSRWLRKIIKEFFLKLKNKIEDPLPFSIREKFQLLNLREALWQIHFPDSLRLAEEAKKRFAFEELFFIELLVLRERYKLAKEKAINIPLKIDLIKAFIKTLPFQLTNAQKRVTWQILKDLAKPRPMNRLLQGDVGSGKTVVATIAALNIAQEKLQVALMAPTEILAKQHFQEISKLLGNFNLKIALLTGKENKLFSNRKNLEISREELLEKLRNGEINFLIGTQALIQEKVKFANLALVILDEQHRFGVEQRARLCQGSGNQAKFIPHLLSMTATPIPRTLALTLYGDLDLSLLDELPKGRKKIISQIIPPEARQKAYNFIKKEVKKGRQVFVICPRIEETEEKEILSWAEAKAVKKEYEKLKKEVFPELTIAMLHGKMKAQEKEKVMEEFRKGKIDILVSTSVIEVGIDVPNATVMMIEGAEKFGLAQLHQLRGRVGRGKEQSFCFLFTESPAKKTRARLNALLSCQDGLKLAEKDLQIRGAGDFIGKRQWGIPNLAMKALKDIFLVEKSRQAAKEILEKDWELNSFPLLKKKLEEIKMKIHLE